MKNYRGKDCWNNKVGGKAGREHEGRERAREGEGDSEKSPWSRNERREHLKKEKCEAEMMHG